MYEDPEAKARGYAAHMERAIRTGELVQMAPTSYDTAAGGREGTDDRQLWAQTSYQPVEIGGTRLFGRGPKSTSGIESLRDGPFRKERAGFRLEIQAVSAGWGLNTPFSNLRAALNGNSIGDELYERIAWDVNRTMQIGALVEAVPLASNTIRPSKTAFDKLGIPKPEIRYSISDYTKKGGDAFGPLAAQIFRAMGSKDTSPSKRASRRRDPFPFRYPRRSCLRRTR